MNRWHKLVFGLILALSVSCFGQTPDQFTLQVQNGGVPVYTRSNFAALNLTGGCSGTVSGGALAITCTGGAANPGGSANQIEYNVAGTSFGGFTMSGDCSIVVSTGVITCTKTSGTAFGPLATQATGSLSTGLAKVTTSTGLLSTAVLGDVTALFTGTGLLRNSGAASEISGDCTTSGSNAITCTKTNGTAFGTAATANLTNTTSFPFQSITTTGTSGPATLSGGVLNIPQYSGGGGGLSGMTAGQVPIAATASTVTSSEGLAGSGAGIVTGPTSGTTAGHLVTEVGTNGQIQDGGIPATGIVVNLIDAGAVCNGSTDDTTAIAAAYATLNGTSGGQIFWPAGQTCILSNTVTLANSQNAQIHGGTVRWKGAAANVTSATAASGSPGSGSFTVTMTTTSGNWPSAFVANSSLQILSCSVSGYNGVARLLTGGSGGTTLTFTLPGSSALGAATGCSVGVIPPVFVYDEDIAANTENFNIKNYSSSYAMGAVFDIIQNSTYSVVSENNVFSNNFIDGVYSGGLNIGFQIGKGTASNPTNDEHKFYSNRVSNYTTAGFEIDFFQSVDIHYDSNMCYGITGVSEACVIDTSGAGFDWKGGFSDSNAIAAYIAFGVTEHPITIDSAGSEEDTRFLIVDQQFPPAFTPTGAPCSVNLLNNRYATNDLDSDGHIVMYGCPGPLNVLGGSYGQFNTAAGDFYWYATSAGGGGTYVYGSIVGVNSSANASQGHPLFNYQNSGTPVLSVYQANNVYTTSGQQATPPSSPDVSYIANHHVPSAAGTYNLGSSSLYWNELFAGSVAINGAPSGSVVKADGTGYLSPFISSLTTTGSSGPATVVSGVLNIPQYTGGGGGSPAGSLYAVQVNNPSGTFGAVNAPTTPNLVPEALCSSPTSGGAATSYTNCLPGLLGRPVTGTTSSDTIQTTDCDPARVAYVGSVSVAVTLPTATTLGVPNCQTKLANNTTGSSTTVTITPTTWTINGGSSLTLLQGQDVVISVDPNSSTNWVADQVEDNLVAGNGIGFTRTPNSGMTIAVPTGGITDTLSSLADKPSVGLVATSNLTLSGAQTIDGVAGTAGTTLVLATAQSTGSQNGPWIMQTGAWTRPLWYPSGGTTQAFQFITTFVRLGTVYQGSVWRMTTSGAITIDTTATAWTVTPQALNGLTVASGQLGNSTNALSSLYILQPAATAQNSITADCTDNTGNTGYLAYLIGEPSSPTPVFTVDCATGNAVVQGTETVGGNFTGNGNTNSFPNGPISSGSTSLTSTACGSTVTGAWCAAEGSVAGTPTAGVDYIRADSASHTLKYSVNGGAEATLPGSGGSSSFPLTVSGTVNSGGFPYFNSTTQESSTSTWTQYSLAVGGGAGASPTFLGAATNGQIPIGSTGAAPVLATISAGSGITVTNGPGTISIAASGGGGGNGAVASVATSVSLTTSTDYQALNGEANSATIGNVAQTVGAAASSVSQLKVILGTAISGSQTVAVTLYDVTASAAEAVTCTVPNSGTTCSDTTHSYSVPAGHQVVWQIVLNSSTATETIAIGAQVGAASTFSGNTSTATSATSGVATAAAGTVLAADGSGNAEPAPAQTTAGFGGIFSNGYPLSITWLTNNTGTVGTTLTYVQQFQVWNPLGQVVGHVRARTVAAGTSATFVACIYSAGTSSSTHNGSLLWSSSASANAANTVLSLSATAVTLLPGVYYIAYGETGTTAATMSVYSGGSLNISDLYNGAAPRQATAANTISGSSCPSNLGALTAASGAVQVIMTLEP